MLDSFIDAALHTRKAVSITDTVVVLYTENTHKTLNNSRQLMAIHRQANQYHKLGGKNTFSPLMYCE